METTQVPIHRGLTQMIDLRRYSIYKMEYYSVIKKEWNTAMCNNMDGLRDYCTKWSESKKYYTISYDITYKWNLKTVQTNLFTL